MNRSVLARRSALRGLVPAVALALAACASAPSKAQHPTAAAPAPAAATAPAAAPQAAAANPAPAPSGAAARLWGSIDSVDIASRALVIRDKRGRVRSLSVAADAVLTKGGDDAAVTLASLRPGDLLRLAVSGTTVRSLHVNVKAVR